MKTKITELLGIKYPIIQGGMAWTSDANLAAAVSNAGGAGIIATGGRTVEWTRDEIRKAKDLTAKPFGVNIMLMAPNIAEIIDVVCEEKVAFVTLGAGNPVPHIEKFHAAEIKVIPVVPSVKLAKRVEEAGVDVMVIEGMEGGGHIGQQTTMALMTNWRIAFGTVDQVVCFVKIFIRLKLSVWCYSGCFFCKSCHSVSYSSLS